MIARLDRLAHNVAVVISLMESGMRFMAVNMPGANSLNIHIMAAVAERETQLISSRIKAALAARKARGLKLGKLENLTVEARASGSLAVQQRAISDMRTVAAYARTLRGQGLSLRAIAAELEQHAI